MKQVVALTGRNTTGSPSHAAPCELRCILEMTTDDDDRRQRAILAPYSMCRQASNKEDDIHKFILLLDWHFSCANMFLYSVNVVASCTSIRSKTVVLDVERQSKSM